MKQQWWQESVVYQIWPRSFADGDRDGMGDLAGIASRLDYLTALGVDVLWLSPIYPSPQDDAGYDISDYQEIDPTFGSLERFDSLLAAVHERGVKLIMDLVVNHTSDEHPWFVESRASKDNPKRDWYWWRPAREGMSPGDPAAEPNNWGSIFSGPAWELDDETGEYYLHLCLYGDGMHYFVDGPRIHEFLQEMHREVFARREGLITVGEMPGVTVEEAKLYTDPARCELDMVFQFEHVQVDHGETRWDHRPLHLRDLKAILGRWQAGLAKVGWNSLYLSNHDQPRVVSRFGDDGEHRVCSAKMLATVLHLHRGTPYIYQGEELGMTNAPFDSIDDYRDIQSLNHYAEAVSTGADPEAVLAALRVLSRDNARTPMQWDDTENAGFTTGTPWIALNPNHKEINAKAEIADEDSVFHHYRRLIELRHTEPAVVHGDFHMLLADHEQVYAFTRRYGTTELLVLANFSKEPATIEVTDADRWKGTELVLANYPVDAAEDIEHLALRPWEARVYRAR